MVNYQGKKRTKKKKKNNHLTVTKRIFLDLAYFLSCDIIQYQPRSKQNFSHFEGQAERRRCGCKWVERGLMRRKDFERNSVSYPWLGFLMCGLNVLELSGSSPGSHSSIKNSILFLHISTSIPYKHTTIRHISPFFHFIIETQIKSFSESPSPPLV